MKWCFILLFSVSTFVYANDWKKVRSENGVDIYAKSILGSDLLAFKAEGIVEMPYGKALALLRDVEASAAWDESLIKKVTIKDISDIEAITYSIVDMPWPLKDRDMVLVNKLEYDKETKELVVISHSVTDDKYPPNGDHVRANLRFANMRFLPLEDGKSKLQMEIHVDPKGSIPDWVINMVQKNMPMDFISRLKIYSKIYPKGPNKGVWDMIQVQKEELQKVKKSASVSNNN